MSGTRVIVLMKPLAESKSRLASALSPGRRALLSLGAFAHVLRTAASVEGIDDVLAVGGDELIAAVARRSGASWQPEPGISMPAGLREGLSGVPTRRSDHAEARLNPALREVFEASFAEGWHTCLYLPADLPLLSEDDVNCLLDSQEAGATIALAPDRAEQGTNALLLTKGVPFEPSFGIGSFQRHMAAAKALLVEPGVCRGDGLLLDVDTPDDLDVLLALRETWWEDTAAMLKSLDLPEDAMQLLFDRSL